MLDDLIAQVRAFARTWSRYMLLLEDLPANTSIDAVYRYLGRPGKKPTFTALNQRAVGRFHRSEDESERKARAQLGKLPADYAEFLTRYGSLTLVLAKGRERGAESPFALYTPTRAPDRGAGILHLAGVEEIASLPETKRAKRGRVTISVVDMKTFPGFYGGVELDVKTGAVHARYFTKPLLNRPVDQQMSTAGFTGWLGETLAWLVREERKALAKQGAAKTSKREAQRILDQLARGARPSTQSVAKTQLAMVRKATAGKRGAALVDASMKALVALAETRTDFVILEAESQQSLIRKLGKPSQRLLDYHQPNIDRFRKPAGLGEALAKLGKLPRDYVHFLERWGSLTVLDQKRRERSFLPGNQSGQGLAITQVLRAEEAAEQTRYIRNLIDEADEAGRYTGDHLLVFHGDWSGEGRAFDLATRGTVVYVNDDQVLGSAYSRGKAPKRIKVADDFATWLRDEVFAIAGLEGAEILG